MKPLLVTSGEPAGIGPDICLALAHSSSPVVVAGDIDMLTHRAKQLGTEVQFKEYNPNNTIDTANQISKFNQISVLHVPLVNPVKTGILDAKNASYVINMLEQSIDLCLNQEFSGLVTAPVHKAILNEAGYVFTGHTEFLEERCKAEKVVMLLISKRMKVALVTTHLPLCKVAPAITQQLVEQVITCVHHSLHKDFAINNPKLIVAGLNPHAGESGFLGLEEIEIITPALNKLFAQGVEAIGPMPADTMFNDQSADVYIGMYHDQVLPVIKYADFENAVNVTLGLPIIRTSVDHGTALALAGSGKASSSSLIAAVECAALIVKNRIKNNDQY